MDKEDIWNEARAKRFAWLTLTIILLLTGVFAGAIFSGLKLDYDFEKFFPKEDSETKVFFEHREQFGTDNDFVLVSLKNEKGVFNTEFLRDVERLTSDLEALDYIDEVLSPTDFKRYSRRQGSLTIQIDTFPLLHIGDDEALKEDSVLIMQDDRYVGTFFSDKSGAISLFVKTEDYLSKEKCDKLGETIPALLESYDKYEFHYAGRSVGQSYYISLMQRDLMLFISSSIVLLIFFLIIAFKSVWGVVVPLNIVMLSNIWILGFMALIGEPVNMILTMLPTIIFVVGMSDVVHMVSKYLEELRSGNSKMNAIRVAFKEIGLATLLTSITTAIGFLTLLSSTVEPIRIFGLYTAIGVIIAFILAFTVLPSVLILMGKPKAVERNDIWKSFLRKQFLWVIRHPRLTLSISAGVTLVAVLFTLQIRPNNYLLEDLPSSNEMKSHFIFFEENFSGVRPFEMNVRLKDPNSSVFDYEVAREIDQMENYLRDTYGIGGMMSMNVLIKSANQTNNGGTKESYCFPKNEKDFKQAVRPFKKVLKDYKRSLTDTSVHISEEMAAIIQFVDTSLSSYRIRGRMGDLGSLKIFEMNDDLEAYYKNELDSEVFEYTLTGTAHLIDKNNAKLARNMLLGLLIAFLLVALIMGGLFRSVKMMLISLVPNIIPLIIISGILGATGTDLKVSISIIFTIAFGICVDDTIHFMSKLKIERMKGLSMIYSLKRAYMSTGRAIIITSLILCSGFLMLVFSEFLGTFYVGYLISITLFIAVVADLYLLPALIILTEKKKKK